MKNTNRHQWSNWVRENVQWHVCEKCGYGWIQFLDPRHPEAGRRIAIHDHGGFTRRIHWDEIPRGCRAS